MPQYYTKAYKVISIFLLSLLDPEGGSQKPSQTFKLISD